MPEQFVGAVDEIDVHCGTLAVFFPVILIPIEGYRSLPAWRIIASASAGSRNPSCTSLAAAAVTTCTYSSCEWYRSSSDGRGSPFASRSAFVFANGMNPPTAMPAHLSLERTRRRHVPSGVGAERRHLQRRLHASHFVAVRIDLDDELRQRPLDLPAPCQHAGRVLVVELRAQVVVEQRTRDLR